MPDTTVIILVFAFVYLGMILGRFPGLAMDRTGIALIGAIILLAGERIELTDAWHAVDVPTIGLLFGLMVLSAQFRLGGLYTAITRRIVVAEVTPPALLAIIIAVCGLLSALLANDIVCLAVAPLLVESCARRRLNPLPFLLGLACASNIGSAATLIGNPQNMLIGQKLRMSFGGYLLDGLVPAILGLAAAWAILVRQTRGRWEAETPLQHVDAPRFNPYQSGKGMVILIALVIAFLATPIHRELLALAAAGVILTSRKMHSRRMLGLVDWDLLVLFIALFIVNEALESTGALTLAIEQLNTMHVDLGNMGWLFAITAILSNLVSNVPATMLLLPAASAHGDPHLAGSVLALSSTLAGNLFIAGSIANIIVVNQAERLGVHIGWREHARAGVPVTLATLLIAAGWLALRSVM